MIVGCKIGNSVNKLPSMMIFLALLMFVLFLALIRRLVESFMGSIAIVLTDIGSPRLSKQAEAFLLSDSNDRYFGPLGLCLSPCSRELYYENTRLGLHSVEWAV
jgi:hypothetical protein